MEVRLSNSARFPDYPYWKVAVAGDRAEVAEIACEDGRTESLIYHGDLETRLRENYPELAGGGFFSGETRFLAGWLTVNGEEAILRLQLTADGLSEDDADRIERALSEWCNARGIRRLTIADASGGSGPAATNDPGWNLA